MSTPRIPAPGMLVISVLSAHWDLFWPDVRSRLEDRFGASEPSELFPFTQTEYYDPELDTPISRRLVSFERLEPLDSLADIKLFTNSLEGEYARDHGRRLFNLDPGFVTLQSLVLATGKNFTHRIYLRDGIWADLTLMWQHKRWVDFPWTFPDYAGADMKSRLTKLRQSYKTLLSKPENGPAGS